MARKASAKLMLNRSALTAVGLALAEGVEEVCRTIVETAHPNDAPPFGKGLVQAGGWIVFLDGKKVAGGSLAGTQPKKPRNLPIPPGIVGLAGFGFPARFHEMGTVDTEPHPFLAPAAAQVAPHAPAIMAGIVGPRLKRHR